MIGADMRARLHAYLGGIVRELGGRALAVGGVADHVHLLLALPPAISVAEADRVVKANSSKWVHVERGQRLFAWQAGYAAFTVSQSNAETVAKYIRQQEQHHRRQSFQYELRKYLQKNDLTYDELYLWT